LKVKIPFIHQETEQRFGQVARTIKDRALVLDALIGGASEDTTVDTAPILAYLPALHVRRTLDQYFLTGTEVADASFVYRRHQEKEMKILIVDQLWLWILDEGLTLKGKN
jgi:hypothetical protein